MIVVHWFVGGVWTLLHSFLAGIGWYLGAAVVRYGLPVAGVLAVAAVGRYAWRAGRRRRR